MGAGETRRAFLMAMGGAAAMAVSARARGGSATGGAMPMRPLGRTGVDVSLMGIGGFHLGLPSEKDAIRIVQEAIDRGATFLDNCWDYNHGESQRRMGKALRGGYRERAFVMTKLDGRTADSAARQLDDSLRALGIGHVDLLQIHEVIRPSDPERVFGRGGAIEAYERAREQGKTRFIGFTGHKSPDIHLAMLQTAKQHGFRFDAVQMPLNVMDAHMGAQSFEKQVLPILLREGIGVLGMKPMGSGGIPKSGVVSAASCLRYAMSLPVSVTITGVDSADILHQGLHAALRFEAMSDREKEGVLAQTAAAAHSGRYEQYKTTTRFDGTTSHPRWLDSAELGG
ncbi:MAG: aldo/keto reductase [Polyangiaceae bacterium]|nr:aldo/keto reductase [Polyangiaceae bacterium]